MQIRRMEKKDAPIVHKIGNNEKNLYPSEGDEFWDVEQLEDWTDSKDDILLVASEDNKIVGFILSILHKPTGNVEIESIWVHEDFRGTGLSKKLLNMAIDELKKKSLIYIFALMKNTNDTATKFFIDNGFTKSFGFYCIYKYLLSEG